MVSFAFATVQLNLLSLIKQKLNSFISSNPSRLRTERLAGCGCADEHAGGRLLRGEFIVGASRAVRVPQYAMPGLVAVIAPELIPVSLVYQAVENYQING